MNIKNKRQLLSLLRQYNQHLKQQTKQKYTGKKYQKIELYGHKFEIKFVDREYYEAENDMDQMQEYYQDNFDIYVDGKKVGYANKDYYFGAIQAQMWNRYMPDLSGYNSSAHTVPDHFKAFITNTRSGAKWLRVSLKDIPK